MPKSITWVHPLDDIEMPGDNVLVDFVKELGFGFGCRVKCHFLVPGQITARSKTRFTVTVENNSYPFMRRGTPYGKPLCPMSVTYIEGSAVEDAARMVAADLHYLGGAAVFCSTLEAMDLKYREMYRLTRQASELWQVLPSVKRNDTIPVTVLHKILNDPGSNEAIENAVTTLKIALKFEG